MELVAALLCLAEGLRTWSLGARARKFTHLEHADNIKLMENRQVKLTGYEDSNWPGCKAQDKYGAECIHFTRVR